MKTSFHLIVKRSGQVRTTVNLPKLEAGEVAVHVALAVPDALFKAPQLQATITIPDSAVPTEPLTADVQDNVREAIQQVTGLEVRLIVEAAPAAEGA